MDYYLRKGNDGTYALDMARTRALELFEGKGKDTQISVIEAPSKRSIQINALMWVRLTDVAKQIDWPVNGIKQKLSPTDWKHIFTAALQSEERQAEGLEGGHVFLGKSTSQMTQAEMSDLIALIESWGASNGVRFTENRYG